MSRRTFALTLLIVSLLSTPMLAHYLWVTVDNKSGEHGIVNIYFEGGPGAGDGQYLDPFIKRGKTWVRTLKDDKAVEIKVADTTKEDKRWLSAELAKPGPRSVDMFGMWGVYRYGTTDVLLHYYARHIEADDHDDLHVLERAPHLNLDIVPHIEAGTMTLKVLWKGKPAADCTIAVRGPGGFKLSPKTNKFGVVSFKVENDGRYTFRTSVEQQESGTQDGKEFQLKRHHATLVMTLPIAD